MAVDTLEGFCPFPEEGGGPHLLTAIRTANQRIRQRGFHEPTLYGMGTTLVSVLIQNDRAIVAHVGDSRGYLIQGSRIRQMTRDHTVTEEKVRAGELSSKDAGRHPERHILSRALGVDESVDIDQTGFSLQEGDLLLLCSDGLTNMLNDDEILQTVLATGSKDPSAVTHELIHVANEKGGVDNITVVVVKTEHS
jgi:protein phosphatase